MLDVLTVRRGRGLALGERDGDFPVSREVLGTSHLQLVTWRGAVPLMTVPVHSVVRRAREAEGLREGIGDGAAEGPRIGGSRVALGLGDAITLDFGSLSVSVEHGAGERLARPVPRLEWRPLVVFAVAVAVQAALVATAAFTVPAMADGDEPSRHERFRLVTVAPWSPTEVVPPETAPPPPDPVRELWGAATSRTGLVLQFTDTPPECPGSEVAPADPRLRAAVMGPADNPDPRVSSTLADRDACCIGIGILPMTQAGEPAGPIAPWAGDVALGSDAASAVALGAGDEIGTAHGASPSLQAAPATRGRLRKVLTLVGTEPLPASAVVRRRPNGLERR